MIRFCKHCQISYREGLGMSPCIMVLTTQDPYILKEHIELYKILKFRVNWANIKPDTAIQKLRNLLTTVWIAGHLSGKMDGNGKKEMEWEKGKKNVKESHAPTQNQECKSKGSGKSK